MVAAFIIIADLKRKTISELFKDTDFLLLNEFYNAFLKGMFFGSFVECMWEMGTPVTHDKSCVYLDSFLLIAEEKLNFFRYWPALFSMFS